MDQETITEDPGNASGVDSGAGITTEADLGNPFLERDEESVGGKVHRFRGN
jgi:hypothetical protein